MVRLKCHSLVDTKYFIPTNDVGLLSGYTRMCLILPVDQTFFTKVGFKLT